MDLQGSGYSTRPTVMDNPHNAYKPDQPRLVPNPLAAPDPPTVAYPYGRYVNTLDSDLSEVERVIYWIGGYTGARKVNLVGYSAAAFVLGPLAMRWGPELVESLFLLAPIFPPYGLGDYPLFLGDPAKPVPASLQFPMRIQSKTDPQPLPPPADSSFLGSWDSEVGAVREPDIAGALWDEIMKHDQFASQWGGTGNPPEGVMRFRNAAWWGWNKAKVEQNAHLGVDLPVCIVYGTCDTQVFASIPPSPAMPQGRVLPPPGGPGLDLAPGPPFSVKWLYDALPDPNRKLMVAIDKTGHFMPWETQYEVLHRYSLDWIRNRSIESLPAGSYHRTQFGQLVPA